MKVKKFKECKFIAYYGSTLISEENRVSMSYRKPSILDRQYSEGPLTILGNMLFYVAGLVIYSIIFCWLFHHQESVYKSAFSTTARSRSVRSERNGKEKYFPHLPSRQINDLLQNGNRKKLCEWPDLLRNYCRMSELVLYIQLQSNSNSYSLQGYY